MKRRIFIAVDISEEARCKVSEYIENLRSKFPRLRVGWEKAEKLHLTLKFLGETDDFQLENVKKITEKISKEFENFKLNIANTGVFPSTKKARVLWIDVFDEKGSLAKMNEILEIECEKIGFAREKRNYKPHLTIARLREPQFSGDLVKTHLENEFSPIEFDVSEIEIYESQLQLKGSVYQKVQSNGFSRDFAG